MPSPSAVDYSHDNFEVGTKSSVRVSTKVSCCLASVSLRALDLTGEEYNRDFEEGAGAGTGIAGSATTSNRQRMIRPRGVQACLKRVYLLEFCKF